MHLVVSISGHGFGHVAQTAPVLNALYGLFPDLRITVRSPVAERHLKSRIRIPFAHLQSEGDIGMVMTSPLAVDIEKSRAAYRAFHADWAMRVKNEARLLETLQADYVLSNVGYLPLAGAALAGIAHAALCSLNWADIYRHYCILAEQDEIIAAQIQACYTDADAFLRATPGMDMEYLPNLVPVAPIAEVGDNRRGELNYRLKLSGDEKLLLISLGGIAGRLPVENWPRAAGMRYLVQSDWQIEHPDAVVIESLPLAFSDLLASSDALICKPGYGSFVEAACCNVPVLYVGRPDWPESPALVAWLNQHGRCREFAHGELLRGDMQLERLWHMPAPQTVSAAGMNQVAAWLAEKLQASADGRPHRAHDHAPAHPRSPGAHP